MLVEQENGPGRLSEQEECLSRLQLLSQVRLVDSNKREDGRSRLQLPSQVRLVSSDKREDGPSRMGKQEEFPSRLPLPSQIRLEQDDGKTDGMTEPTIEQLPGMHEESRSSMPEERLSDSQQQLVSQNDSQLMVVGNKEDVKRMEDQYLKACREGVDRDRLEMSGRLERKEKLSRRWDMIRACREIMIEHIQHDTQNLRQ